MMLIGVPSERAAGETRVAATPETVAGFVKAGFDVWVERGAGAASLISDTAYTEAGASVVEDAAELLAAADAVLKVGPPAGLVDGKPEASLLRDGALLVGMLAPHRHLDTVASLARHRITACALELLPRIARAQAMDALSSQSNIAGYRAVIVAALQLPRYFPMLMTAAGTVRPARVLVVGGGVAGLQAVATARRLGAVVTVADVRPEVEEQAASLGARFVAVPDESASGSADAGGHDDAGDRDAADAGGHDDADADAPGTGHPLAEAVAAADAVITAALIPGQRAPQLVSSEMVAGMAPGSVVVDVAVAEGGNCELSAADEVVGHHGASVLAPTDLVTQQAVDASALYARNMAAFVELLDAGDGQLRVDVDEEIVQASLITTDGSVVHEPTAARLREVDA